jgi:hypothetical protein
MIAIQNTTVIVRLSTQRVVRDQRPGISGGGDASDGVVKVLLDGELTDLVDLGVVDLDLVDGTSQPRTEKTQRRGGKQKSRRKATP